MFIVHILLKEQAQQTYLTGDRPFLNKNPAGVKKNPKKEHAFNRSNKRKEVISLCGACYRPYMSYMGWDSKLYFLINGDNSLEEVLTIPQRINIFNTF